MALSPEQIKEALKAPKAAKALAKAVRHEEKLRFHAEEVQDKEDASRYAQEFLAWAKSKLAGGKADMFEWALRYPVYTNEIIKAMAEEYQKVYGAENSSFTYLFSNEEGEGSFADYLTEIDFWKGWKDVSSDAIFRRINSIVVVDMPQESSQTEPYYYFLPVESVKDVSVNDKGAIDYLIVRTEDVKRFYLFDEISYKLIDDDGNILKEAPHPLGYCPASFFWKDPIKRTEPIGKRSPISAALNNLDQLLYWETSRRCNESFAAWPILVSYTAKCDYKTNIDGIGEVSCKGGVLDLRNGKVWDCPVCAKSRFTGFGTHIKMPMLTPGQNQSQMGLEAAKFINVDVGSLEYCTKRSAELWDEIYFDCVGYDGDNLSKQAVNERQVKAHFESKQNILLNLKENLEASHRFIIYTIAKLKYGDAFIDCAINYGTDFYLKTDSELIDEYTQAKNSGAPQYFLNHKRSQIDSVATKGNDDDVARMNILKHLEPWSDSSLMDCKSLGFDSLIPERFLLKADFSGLVLRFESELGDIVNFGNRLSFEIKIQKIKTKLLEYVKSDTQPQAAKGQPQQRQLTGQGTGQP